MPLAPPSVVLCDAASVKGVLSRFGVTLRLDDDRDGVASSGEAGFLDEITYEASEEVLNYLGRYEPTALAASYLVRGWARRIAAKLLCLRRGNPVPKSLLDEVGTPEDGTGVYGRLVRVHQGQENLLGIAERVTPAMGWVNVRVIPGYPLRKARVEVPLSEPVPVKGTPLDRDYSADFIPRPY